MSWKRERLSKVAKFQIVEPSVKIEFMQQIDMRVNHQYNNQRIDHRRTVHRSVGDRKQIACRPPVGEGVG